MPELPDVETWKRYVDSTALHQRIAAVDVSAPRMLQGITGKRLAATLEGGTFKSTARHGKYLFVGLSGDGWLLLHFGMTGYLRYRKEDADELDGARLVVRFTNRHCLAGFWQRRLGRIGLVEGPGAFVESEGLGPDALDPAVDLATFREMLGKRRGAVKSALMDQGLIAGIGSVYSDEMLFQAGLHPKAAAHRLDEKQTRDLHGKMGHVLEVASERQADPERLPKSWLLPHRQEGARCPRCGRGVERVKAAGRTAYFCPACQKGGG